MLSEKEYPRWYVEGYVIYDYDEAHMLAFLLSEKFDRPVIIMQKDDESLPAFVLQRVYWRKYIT